MDGTLMSQPMSINLIVFLNVLWTRNYLIGHWIVNGKITVNWATSKMTQLALDMKCATAQEIWKDLLLVNPVSAHQDRSGTTETGNVQTLLNVHPMKLTKREIILVLLSVIILMSVHI